MMTEGLIKEGDTLLCMVPESGRFVISFMHLTAVSAASVRKPGHDPGVRGPPPQPPLRAVVYLYSQTGQLREVADALTAPLAAASGTFAGWTSNRA